MAAFLDMYEPLDVIGNGSFGIIRKVRRKSDGLVRAFLSLLNHVAHDGMWLDFRKEGVEF